MSKLTKALTASAAGGDKLYVEDVFSTYVYPGNNSTLTITNGIDLAGEGGMVWSKARNSTDNNRVYDTERGTTNGLITNATNAPVAWGDFTSYNSDGYSLASGGLTSPLASNFVSWTFRKAKKFFDVVTWTGDNTAGRTIAHNLGTTPGMFIVKGTNNITGWVTWHRSLADGGGYGGYLNLETVSAAATSGQMFGTASQQTSSVITLGSAANITQTNANSYTYVAYLFAHDAGGFGADGGESIIKCGSYTGNGNANGPEINLGWEPQYLLIKQSSASGNGWFLFDSMRGTATGGADSILFANDSRVELLTERLSFNATGFTLDTTASSTNGSGQSYIYMAIRRPMKVPEAGTEVFGVRAITETTDYQQIVTGNLVDFGFQYLNGNGSTLHTRLLGQGYLNPTSSGAANTSAATKFDFMDGFEPHYAGGISGFNPRTIYGFTRAPEFMDVVAYTGTGGLHVVAHNLGALPEMVIIKARSANGIDWWACYSFEGTYISRLRLNTDGIAYEMLKTEVQQVMSGDVTSSTFQVGTNSGSNGSGTTYVAYLFATLEGVSKVGSYTGNAGSAVNVDCGFSNGARFILIKRTDSTGDWYTYDSARGITAGNDPYFLLNTKAAQVTNTDYIDPLSAGFTVTSSAPAALNASGGNYIFLAIA